MIIKRVLWDIETQQEITLDMDIDELYITVGAEGSGVHCSGIRLKDVLDRLQKLEEAVAEIHILGANNE